jgi:uncharacterized membrane protein
MKNNLETKAFDKWDWIPIVGAVKLLDRIHKLKKEITEDKYFQAYVSINAIYNVGIIFTPILLYMKK